MKSLNEIISAKLTSRYPELQGNPCSIDILTEEEKAQQIEYAIEQAQKAYAFRLYDKGAHQLQILERIAMKDWKAEIDIPAVLQAAANRKYWYMQELREQAERRQKELEQRQGIEAEWTAEKYREVISDHYRQKAGEFRKLPGQQRYINALAYFLARDPRFEYELGYSLTKGLMIMGGPGLGKTETLKAVSRNPRTPFSIISILEITDQVKEYGVCELNMNRNMVIDDVGTEPVPVKYYGTEVNWFKDFIEMAYLKQPSFQNMIITTNAGGDQIQQLYGYRVRSRLRDMFNVIEVTGEDQRK